MLPDDAPGRTVHISLSELETTLRKAASGTGLSLGLGEEAGLAARWMAINGIAGLSAFADALDAVDNGRSGQFDADLAIAGTFVASSEGLSLSALYAGPSACDLLEAAALSGNGPNAVTMTAVDFPAVVLCDALAVSERMKSGIRVAWRSRGGRAIEAVCRAGRLDLAKGVFGGLAGPGPVDLSMALVDHEAGAARPNSAVLANGITVDDHCWSRVLAYAARCLVEATDASRLTGAGAGVVDSD